MRRYTATAYTLVDADLEPRHDTIEAPALTVNVAAGVAWVQHTSNGREHGEVIAYDATPVEPEPGIEDLDVGDPVGCAYYLRGRGWYHVHGRITLTYTQSGSPCSRVLPACVTPQREN